MKDKSVKTKKKPTAAKTKVKAKPKSASKPATKKSSKKVAEKKADTSGKTVDSTTAWAQKRGLKQIVIWGPEATRDKIRVAADKAAVKMSTWILAAVAEKLGVRIGAPPKSAKKEAVKPVKPVKPVKKVAKVKTEKTPKTSKVSKAASKSKPEHTDVPPAVATEAESSSDEVTA